MTSRTRTLWRQQREKNLLAFVCKHQLFLWRIVKDHVSLESSTYYLLSGGNIITITSINIFQTPYKDKQRMISLFITKKNNVSFFGFLFVVFVVPDRNVYMAILIWHSIKINVNDFSDKCY